MSSTVRNIQKMQDDLELKIPHHVVGLAFGDPSETNIQALASVSLGWEPDDYGNFRDILKDEGVKRGDITEGLERGDINVPVLFISEPIVKPSGKHTESMGELLHALVRWSKKI